nr:hypothetical protein Iba_chr13fCG9060 [Ipomoea batatas]
MSSAICSLRRSQDHSMMVSMPGTLSLIRSTRAAARVSLLRKPSCSSDDRPLAERFVRLRGSTSSTSGSCLFSFPRRLWPWVIWRSEAAELPDGVSVGVEADTSMIGGSEDVLAAAAFFAPRATLARGGRGALGAVMKALSSTIRDGFIGNRPRFILLTSAIIWGLEIDLLVALGGSEDEVVIYLGGDLRGRVRVFGPALGGLASTAFGADELASPGAGNVCFELPKVGGASPCGSDAATSSTVQGLRCGNNAVITTRGDFPWPDVLASPTGVGVRNGPSFSSLSAETCSTSSIWSKVEPPVERV